MELRAVIFSDHIKTTDAPPSALRRLYGVSIVERHIRTLASYGITDVIVIGATDSGGAYIQQHVTGLDATWIASAYPVTYMDTNIPPSEWTGRSDHPCLLIDAHHIYDQRALDAIIQAGPNTMLVDTDDTQEDRTEALCNLAIVDAACLARLTENWTRSSTLWEALTILCRQGVCRRLNLHAINPYIVNLRRSIPLFCLSVTSPQDERTGEKYLIDAAQKGTLDFPAQYLHPPVENWMTRLVSHATAITPNHVTTVTNFIAFVATGLIWVGALKLGLVLAVLVGVLDGVDGKLARVTVRCTKFGDRFEHILDNIYELSWYWVLGWMLSENGTDHLPLLLSGIVTVAYLLDRAATGLFKHFRNIELFDYAPIDRYFRSIGGRRNIYVLVLLTGALVQAPFLAFQGIAVWSIVTALFHWLRAIWLFKQSSKEEHPAALPGEAAS